LEASSSNITVQPSASIGDCEFCGAHAWSSVRIMPKNTPPPSCPKCRKPMRFLLHKTGGRKFQCLDCDEEDPLKSRGVARLLTGELKPLERPPFRRWSILIRHTPSAVV